MSATRYAVSTADKLFYSHYDAMFAGKDYAGEVETVLRLGNCRAPARILEIGSGTGNHTQALARLGHTVVAVDGVDGDMVRVARKKIAALPPQQAARIRYVHGDVQQLPLETYDLATAMFNVVTYIPDIASLESMMEAVASRLKPGASFVFDAWNGVAALRDPPVGKTMVVETKQHTLRIELTCRTDAALLRSDLCYCIEATSKEGGAPEYGKHPFIQTLWTPAVISEAAASAGLMVAALHPFNDLSRPATESDRKVLFHCRKI